MELTQLLESLGIPYRRGGEHHHVRTGWIGIDCPSCGRGTEKFHLGINQRSFACVCWRCGARRLYDVLLELTDEKQGEVYKLLKTLESSSPARKQTEKPQGRLKLPSSVGELLKPHKRYLRKRGFDPDEISKVWNVQGLGIAGRYSWRLFIPIVLRGATVSWTTRAISDDEGVMRYLTSPPDCELVSSKSLLYGEDFATHAVIVVEGPTDAWRIGPGAVATFGLNTSAKQLERLSRYAVRAICFDNEPRAQRRAQQLARSLSLLPGVTFNIQLDSADPGSAQVKEIRKIRKRIFGET